MIIETLALICIGVLLQCAEPIILIKRAMGFKEEEYDTYSKEWRFVHRLLYCAMCLTFWVALFWTWNLEIAAISSVGAALLHKNLL